MTTHSAPLPDSPQMSGRGASLPEPGPRGAGGGPGRGNGRVPPLFLITLVLANYGLWLAFFTPIVLTLQLKARALSPDSPETTIALVLGTASVFAILANPVTGNLSDRTTSRWGMRRPWLVGAVLVGFIGLVVQGTSTAVPLLVLGGCLSLMAFASSLTVLFALMPDHVPAHRRGLVSGLLGVSQSLATVSGVSLGGALRESPLVAYCVPGAIGMALVLLLCLVLRDRRLHPADRRPFRFADFWRSFWVSPRRYPDFGWAWLSRFTFFLAFGAVINYLVFFLGRQIAVEDGAVPALVAAGLALQSFVLMASSAVAGAVSDRLGQRRPILVASALIGAAGLGMLAFATTVPVYFAAMAVMGVAQGVYFSVDLALISEVLPDQKRAAAKGFGVMTVANQLPQLAGPITAPLLLAVGIGSVVGGDGPNYTALYLGSAVFVLISGAAILKIRGVR